MSEELRFLIVEDLPADVELEVRELRKAGLAFSYRRVDTEAGFRDAVRDFRPHLIISDYSLPAVDGMEFLAVARVACPGVPFLFVSGTIGEDRAVEALKQGATDYVLKDRLASLPERVRRALKEADGRRQRERLEEQLRQAQKVDAIGRLAGGVAHDFNNLLTVISGYTDLSMRDMPDGPARDGLEQVQKAAGRAGELTRQLLAFGRRQVLAPAVLDLNAIVADIERMLRRLIGEDVEFVTSLAPGLDAVRADHSQIEQVIVNLAVNARDAMPRGGRLVIETGNVDLDGAYAQSHVGVAPGPHVMLAVSDTGIGMNQATLEHLFEPFFTTKAPGAGTGLGLATVHGIVTQSGGTIWVYSEPDRGTTFRVYLPRAEASPAAGVAVGPAPAAGGTETILLVEDDDAIRLLARRVLDTRGYVVLEASNGQVALDIARTTRRPIDLLIADVILPNLPGADVAAEVTRLHPGARVLFVSGYTAKAIRHHGVLDAGVSFLEKPFTVAGLAAKVREVLDAPAPGVRPRR
jgi:signal transduction histidine kinase